MSSLRRKRPGSSGGKERRRQTTQLAAAESSAVGALGAAADDDPEAYRRKFLDIDERRLKEWENHQRSQRSSLEHANLLVYFDVAIADVPTGRLVVELFDDQVPLTAENFRSLATGDRGFDAATAAKLDYVDSRCTRIVKGVAMYIGEVQGLSIAAGGAPLKDENFAVRHSARGLLSMATRGPNTGGSMFCIALAAAPTLDYKQVVFGKVIEGLNLLDRVDAIGTDKSGTPNQAISITFCGALNGPKPSVAPVVVPTPLPTSPEPDSAAATPSLNGSTLPRALATPVGGGNSPDITMAVPLPPLPVQADQSESVIEGGDAPAVPEQGGDGGADEGAEQAGVSDESAATADAPQGDIPVQREGTPEPAAEAATADSASEPAAEQAVAPELKPL
jgi:peptidylprolyl isomerase